jgi:hypothetical protein
MKAILFSAAILLGSNVTNAQKIDSSISTKFPDAIAVLNMGTFHMGYTPDASTTEFDEHDQKNVQLVHEVAQKIAEFKPTVIIVESLPEDNKTLQEQYQQYLKNPKMKFEHPSEIELLAYEVGRLSGTTRIYGVDYKQGYNYGIARNVKNGKDHNTYYRYMKLLDDLEKQYPEDKLTVLEHLQLANNPLYLDVLLNINADMLMHISSEGNAEGAEEATKFYHRNMVMYSNLNQIELGKNDRVFILMGATHTAFFNMWMQRSPKYKVEDVLKYLN